MTNAMANIRAQVMQVYDFKPGWVAKVNAMSDYQVMAIYKRFASECFDPDAIKKDGAYSRTTIKKQLALEEEEALRISLEAALEPRKDNHTAYLCKECRGWFFADNPELTECRFCGSPHILKGEFNEDF